MISKFETYEQYKEIYCVITKLCSIDRELVDNGVSLPIKKLTDEALKAMEGCDFIRLHRVLAFQWTSNETLFIAEAEKELDDFNSRVLCSLISSYLYENKLVQEEFKPLIDFHIDEYGVEEFHVFFKKLSSLISAVNDFILPKEALKCEIPYILMSYFARNKTHQSLSDLIDINKVISNKNDFTSFIAGIVNYIDFGNSSYNDYNAFTDRIGCNILKKKIVVAFITEKLKLCGNHSYIKKLMKTLNEEEINSINENVLLFFKEQLKKHGDDSYYISKYLKEISKYEKHLLSNNIKVNGDPKKIKKRI